MNNSFTLGMGETLDEKFNELFSPKKTESHSERIPRKSRNKSDNMRLRVRSTNGGINIVTVDKKTPVYSPSEASSHISSRHGCEFTHIVDYGNHRILYVSESEGKGALARQIVE
ncbi:hypothetical protein MPI44_004613 [Klebsiella oxytoca]|nr:hypothetical protein [Klebsiella oxytoca]